ncbi:MAG: flavin reductase family protein [Candidatus Aenigmarchaeota archaeon]|nr:flavin reductase family protein [Candidatus Aenigmarchaeota archaeon]
MRISEQIFPRVVALIVSTDENEKENVMTASFLMPVSFNPKYVALAIAEERLTFENIKKTREFTLNVCSEEMKEKAIICGSYSGREKDKFELAKLEKEKSKVVKPSLIKEAPISFECRVEFMKKFGDHWLIVGRVVEEHVRKKEFSPLLHKTGNLFPSLGK